MRAVGPRHTASGVRIRHRERSQDCMNESIIHSPVGESRIFSSGARADPGYRGGGLVLGAYKGGLVFTGAR